MDSQVNRPSRRSSIRPPALDLSKRRRQSLVSGDSQGLASRAGNHGAAGKHGAKVPPDTASSDTASSDTAPSDTAPSDMALAEVVSAETMDSEKAAAATDHLETRDGVASSVAGSTSSRANGPHRRRSAHSTSTAGKPPGNAGRAGPATAKTSNSKTSKVSAGKQVGRAAGWRVEERPQPCRRRVLRFSTGFVTSILVHVGLVVVLALCTLSLPVLDIFTVESAPWQPEEEMKLLELSPEDGDATNRSSSSGADANQPFRIDPTRSSELGMLASQQLFNGMVGEGYAGPVNDVRNLPGSLHHQLNVRRRGEGGSAGTASFFGIEARGNAFVYIVDCSNSMAGRRWERALYELQRSIEGLDSDQAFYVVFFDNRAHAMFGEKFDELKMRDANEANRLRFRRWMGSVKLGDWTRPLESMQFALSLEPDAIYLLSDGEFQDDTVGYLKVANPNREGRQQGLESIPIHTVCFESPIGQEQLGTIARDSGGTFRFVP